MPEFRVNGKRIIYNERTLFLLQIGKGRKGSYQTRNRIVGNLKQALIMYEGINIGKGYKKRLVIPVNNMDDDRQMNLPFARRHLPKQHIIAQQG